MSEILSKTKDFKSTVRSLLMGKYGPAIVSFLLCFVLYVLHVSGNVQTMISPGEWRLNDEYMQIAVDLHHDFSVFAKRPFSNLMIDWVQSITGCQITWAFVLVNFGFLFLSGILLFRLSNYLIQNRRNALINVCIYFLSFSMLFSFFPPVYTYDEPIQYCLLLLAFLAFFKERWVPFIAWFSLSLVARENGLILLPVLLLFYIQKKGNWSVKRIFSLVNIKAGLLLISPAILYFVYLTIYMNYTGIVDETRSDFLGRFIGFEYNFQDSIFAIEAFSSFFLVLGLPVYLWRFSINRNSVFFKNNRFLLIAFGFTLTLNSLIVFTTTNAQESRLFALPLFFLWPLFTSFFSGDLRLFLRKDLYALFFRNWKILVPFLLFAVASALFAFEKYEVTIGSTDTNYFDEYLFFSLIAIGLHRSLSISLKKQGQHNVQALKKA